ncbi:MAG: HD domain-containing protein [Chloroflexi bacterium]|nr:HD domain-containing protein [Chloroflexota bacterium]
MRKGTTIPYLSHLFGVTSLVYEDGGDEDEAIAALLHDAVEDQGGRPTLALIEARLGPRVAAIVAGCSDCIVNADESKPPWRARKEEYLAHLADLVTHSRDDPLARSILRVSVADKLHNLRSIYADWRDVGNVVWERFTGGREGTLWYYRALIEAYRSGARSRWLGELERILSALETG